MADFKNPSLGGGIAAPGTTTSTALARWGDSSGATLLDTPQILIDSNGIINCTWTTEKGLQMISSFGAGASDNLVLIQTTNNLYDRPLLRIIDNSTAGGAANIRIDSPNPDIELVESDQVSPAGKYEIAVQGDVLQLNGRNAADTSFEVLANFTRFSHPTNPGSMAIGGIGSGDKANAVVETVAIGSQSLLMCSSTIGASSGDMLQMDASGNFIINNRGNAVSTRVEGDTDANLFYIDGTNDKVNIGFNTAGSSKFNVKGEAQFGIASTTTGRVRLGKSTGAGITIIEPGSIGASDVTLTCPTITGTLALINGTGLGNYTLDGINMNSAANIVCNTSTGTQICTNTAQKVAFWAATPIIQPTTGVAAATFVAGAGTAVNDASTFDGYTLKQITKALRNIGLLA